MATGEQPSPLKCKRTSSSSSRTRNDSDAQWLLIPNNLELGARPKPSKKKRNKDTPKQFQQENLSPSSEVAEGLSCKAKSSFQAFPRVKSNTASWLQEQYMNEEKSKRRVYESDEDVSESDYHQFHQQNVHFPANQAYPDMEHQDHQILPSRTGENESVKSVNDEFKKKETAMVCEILGHIQEFISEAESSWQKLDLSDEPVIKDAFVKLKNIVKDVEGGKDKKLMLHHSASENGYGNDASPSSSTSRVSNTKENIVNRDATGNSILCDADDNEDEEKCNQFNDVKISEEKTEPISSDDSAIVDVREKVAAVEFERRKLKNKLVELQEEKKIKDELLRELCFLKDAANTVSASGDEQFQKAKDKKKKKFHKLQSPSRHLKISKGCPLKVSRNMTLDSDVSASQLGSRPSQPSTTLKRDNVRKEQNASFPARRHYEAEGRANEDPDIPAAPVSVSATVLENQEVQEKIRKLKVAQQHVKVIKDIVVSILETRKSGVPIPVDQLRLLTPMQKAQYFSDEETEEGSDLEKEFLSAAHLVSSEPTTTNVKEVCCDGIKSSILDVDSHKPEEAEETVADNLEAAVGKKEDLAKLQSQFQQLMQIFPITDCKNDDSVRSSGEGAYTLKKIPSRNGIPEGMRKMHSLRTVPHQDNLQLTRQNIVSMEAQNQNPISNLHNRDCNSLKKDNINNLSGKMGKLSIQNSMNSSYPDVLTASNNNMDSVSTLSYELNQNHSLPNEVERKTILDILKQDKKKQKQYDRNQDSKICCNSSIDSEPLGGSNSALAIDSTTLAAWGGSSTQENFEDENEEQAESLEEHDDEESLSVFDKGSVGERRHTTQYSGQFSNMQQYIESVSNIPDKRQRSFHHPIYNRNQNQPVMQSEYGQQPTRGIKPTRQPLSSSSADAGLPRNLFDNATCDNDATQNLHHRPSKFIQELKNHIDQLNALCQNQMNNERPQTAANSHSSQAYSHMSNTYAPLQTAPEIPLPYNQQLLLCLSQCYHALYMQQLEIQHLQRCIWHNMDGENSHQQSNLNIRSNHEDPNFRPHCVPSWPSPFNPSSQFVTEQVSPFSSVPYIHLPMKHYAYHSGNSYTTGTGTQPARAVIHPTSQNNMSAQETLNNQVPPRTRANNFWDNFRSYSRQNLLSTSNSAKRNENIAPLFTPQVRQVYPLVTNGSPNCTADASNTCCSVPSFSEYSREAHNAEDTTTKNTKCNAPVTGTIGFPKKDVPANVNSCRSRNIKFGKCPRVNLQPSLVQPTSNSSATNLIRDHPLFREKVEEENSSSITHNSPSHISQEISAANTTPEASSMLSSDDKSDVLIGLFHEARALKSKSDAMHQKALKMIRDFAMNERRDSDDTFQTKDQNDHTASLSELEREQQAPIQHCLNRKAERLDPLPDITDNEKTNYELASLDNVSGNIQTLPTAAIPPLSKHNTPRTVSTGAVRKKPKVTSTCFSEHIPNGFASSHDSGGSAADSTDPPATLPTNKTIEDIPGFITEKVVAEFAAMLPSLKRRLRDGCTQNYWTVIHDCLFESLRTYLFFCNISLSRKSMYHLRDAVYLFLSLFSGLGLSDIDSDFVKYVEEFVYENITCFITSGQFAPVPSSLDEENCAMEVQEKIPDLCVKMPTESIAPISIKMRASEESVEPLNIKMPKRTPDDAVESAVKLSPVLTPENINFSSQCGAVPQQNILSYEGFLPEPGIPGREHTPPMLEPEECFEDLRCDRNPEAEIGTEADLAEADQSPGQQGSVGEAPENWSLEHEAVLFPRVGAIMLVNGDENRDIEDCSESAGGVELCMANDVCAPQEIMLDDIPTKLCASEEELPQQLKDEQTVQLPSDDAVPHCEFGSENIGDGGPTILR